MANKLRLGLPSWLQLLAGLGLTGLLLSACDPELTALPRPPRRTLGEQVFTEVCQRLAYSAELAEYQAGQRPFLDVSGVTYRAPCQFGGPPPPGAPAVLQELQRQRQTLITLVDQVIPEPLPDALEQTLRHALPAFDGDAAQDTLSGLGRYLQTLAADPEAAAGVTRLSRREGFAPAQTAGGVLSGLLQLPELHAQLVATLPVWSAASDDDPAPPGQAGLQLLSTALSHRLRRTAPVPRLQDPERSARLLLRLLLTSDPALRTRPLEAGIPLVLRDPRGAALLTTTAGKLPPPYVDADSDGLADVDNLGRFVDAGGRPVPVITPFPVPAAADPDQAVARDVQGRALQTKTGPALLYQYQDLDPTVLGALLRELSALVAPDKDVLRRLLVGAAHLLGPRKPITAQEPPAQTWTFSGFDGQDAPLLDLVHGYLQLLTYSEGGRATGADLDRFLGAVQQLLTEQPAWVARLSEAAAAAFDEAKKPAYDAAQLADSSTLYDDLAPVVVRLLRQPGLVSDVLLALADPATADLGQLIGLLMNDSSYLFMSPTQLDSTQPGAVVGSPGKPVRRDRPDSDVSFDPSSPDNNRSLAQRILQLVHDASHLQICNKEGAVLSLVILGIPIQLSTPQKACELFRIDDLALYFLLSFASDAVKDRDPYASFYNAIPSSVLKLALASLDAISGGQALRLLTGIPGFAKYPTPSALARLLFMDNSRRADFLKSTLDLGPCLPTRPGTLCSNQDLLWQQFYNGSLFAIEAVHPRDAAGNLKPGVTFVTAFRPVVDAFAKHDECIRESAPGVCTQKRNAAKILVDLMAVLHRHWPTQRSTFHGHTYELQNQHSGLSAYEPMVQQLLSQGDLWPALTQLASVLCTTAVKDGSGLTLAEVTQRLLRWFFDPQAPRQGGPLRYRDGRTQALRNDGTPTFAPRPDPIIRDVLPAQAQGQVTPYDLLAQAQQRKRARFSLSKSAQDDWQAAVSALADQLLRAQPKPRPASFQNPRLVPLLQALLAHLRDRVRKHSDAKDLPAWVAATLQTDLQDALLSPIFVGIVDLLAPLEQDPQARAAFLSLLSGLLADPGPGHPDGPRFATVLTHTADFLQLLLDDQDLVPQWHALAATVLAPSAPAKPLSPLVSLLVILRRALPQDADASVLQILRNLTSSSVEAPTHLQQASELLRDLNRPQAGLPDRHGTPLSPEDQKQLWKDLSQTLTDPQRGAQRLLDILRSRTPS